MNKPTLLLGALCLLFSGCAEKPTYEQANAVKAKYPGCELREAGSINPSFYVRTPDGIIRYVTLSSATQNIHSEFIIFGPAKPTP